MNLRLRLRQLSGSETGGHRPSAVVGLCNLTDGSRLTPAISSLHPLKAGYRGTTVIPDVLTGMGLATIGWLFGAKN